MTTKTFIHCNIRLFKQWLKYVYQHNDTGCISQSFKKGMFTLPMFPCYRIPTPGRRSTFATPRRRQHMIDIVRRTLILQTHSTYIQTLRYPIGVDREVRSRCRVVTGKTSAFESIFGFPMVCGGIGRRATPTELDTRLAGGVWFLLWD